MLCLLTAALLGGIEPRRSTSIRARPPSEVTVDEVGVAQRGPALEQNAPDGRNRIDTLSRATLVYGF